jgi:hypothetical protein
VWGVEKNDEIEAANSGRERSLHRYGRTREDIYGSANWIKWDLKLGPVTGCPEHDNESSESLKIGHFLSSCNHMKLSKTILQHEINLLII